MSSEAKQALINVATIVLYTAGWFLVGRWYELRHQRLQRELREYHE